MIGGIEAHTFDSTSHVCTTCGAADPSVCQHDGDYRWVAGTYEHVKVCSVCDAYIGDWEPHSYDSTTHKCVCGAVDPSACQHDGDWYWSRNEYSHRKFCEQCRAEFGDAEPHSFDPTTHKCVCGAVEQSACKHDGGYFYEMDSDGHRKFCPECFAYIGDREPHVREGNVCSVCGWDLLDCQHTNIEYSYDDNSHYKNCADCYAPMGAGEHVGMEDGVCDECGYNANAKHNIPAGTHECTDPGCNYFTDCVDANKDCKCDICGRGIHEWSTAKDIDNNSHEVFCSKCGKSAGKESHFDYNNDGKCDACDHKMSGTTGGKDSSLDNVPKTGDVMAPVAILSGLMSVAAIFTKKRFF